jgi:hypothetical protein
MDAIWPAADLFLGHVHNTLGSMPTRSVAVPAASYGGVSPQVQRYGTETVLELAGEDAFATDEI